MIDLIFDLFLLHINFNAVELNFFDKGSIPKFLINLRSGNSSVLTTFIKPNFLGSKYFKKIFSVNQMIKWLCFDSFFALLSFKIILPDIPRCIMSV